MTNLTVTIVALSLLGCGCVEKSKRLSKAERELAAEIVMKSPPKPQHALDIRFENKITLLGYDVSRSSVQAGEPFTVTWYWQVQSPLGEGWKAFTHLADAEQKNRLNLDAARPLRELHPEDQWKKGQFIKDRQGVTLPSDWKSNAATFYVGFWNGPHRLHVTSGPKDDENRARALSLPVSSGKAAETALPRLIARRVTSPLTLDGKLDDEDWKQAQPSSAMVQTMTGAQGAFTVIVRVLYDAEKLYVGYQVEDDFLKSTFEKDDDHLWEQDTVEWMVDPDGDEKNYFEIQVAPTGRVFDTRYDSRRLPRPFGEIAWSSQAAVKVSVDGKVNDQAADKGYSVELAVPFGAFAAGATPATPPAAGATWRMNFFVMDAREKGQRAVGWSPPMVGDFHTLDRFGRVIFPEPAVPVN